MPKFELVSKYQPTGDQPEAIRKLTENLLHGVREQTLLGVTGSGKTFTMANVIQNIQNITIYPKEYFNPKSLYDGKITITENTRSIHYYTMTWLKP